MERRGWERSVGARLTRVRRARSGRPGIQPAAAVSDGTPTTRGSLGVARLPPVGDQVDVRFVRLLEWDQCSNVVVCLFRGHLLWHQANTFGDSLNVPVDGYERHPEAEEQHHGSGLAAH